jgi:2,4-dienoyl-CoA reductase-like NADH-dependent reductase (Old Yellow Enzyme family)
LKFSDCALSLLLCAQVPLMVTGGFRTRAGMEHALQAGVAVVGLARPMVLMMDAPKQLLGGLEVGSSRRTSLQLLDARGSVHSV